MATVHFQDLRNLGMSLNIVFVMCSFFKIPESFADCLGGLLSVMGQNVSVKLEAEGDVILQKVHTSKSINWNTTNKR